jgi:hypothetical protein
MIGLILHILFVIYAFFSGFIGLIIMTAMYFSEEEKPFSFGKEAWDDVKTVGELLTIIVCFPAWIASVIGYGVVKVFYNRFTIKLANVKIKK